MASGFRSLCIPAVCVAILFLLPQFGQAAPNPSECQSLARFRDQARAPESDPLAFLEDAEAFVDRESPRGEKATCLKWIADSYRELGAYAAERVYLKAVELAPNEPWLLEAVAQYYRTYRGARGLFAESEAFYLRAETALEESLRGDRPQTEASQTSAANLRERILRGRIELNKREGLGLLVPGAPGDRLGIYLETDAVDGQLFFAHNDLVTPTRTLLNLDGSFDPRLILRDREHGSIRNRLRLRFGVAPYLDLAWNRIEETNTLASQSLPIFFDGLDVEEFEIGAEDSAGSDIGDVLWRIDYREGTFDPEGPAKEEFHRLTAATTLTRNFGRVKADFTLLGSDARVDLLPGGGEDDDRLFAANLRLLHFRHTDYTKRPIDPLGYEYAMGYVSRRREFGPEVLLIQDTYFGSVKLTEFIPHTDFDFVANYFQNEVRGRTKEDSSNLELNAIFTHRLIDRLNAIIPYQSQRSLGINQWAATLRLAEDLSTRSFKDLESHSLGIGSFVELFSGPLGFSTLILEGVYEIRKYHDLDITERRSLFSLHLGL